jgi:G3E family GTPase
MNLRVITPIAVGDGEEPWAPGLLQAFLLRAQFSRSKARALGWRGIKPSRMGGESWTCRVHGRLGVYGLLFEEERKESDRLNSVFSLHYFPHPDEPRAEMLPLLAAAMTQAPDYWERVREFPLAEGTDGAFRVATLRVNAGRDGEWLGLGFDALSRQRTVSLDGIPAPDASGRFIVPPGGLESDVAAYSLCLHFFTTLASTVTFGLQEAPSRVRLRVAPGEARAFSESHGWMSFANPRVKRILLDLHYGDCLPVLRGGEGVLRKAWRRGLPLEAFQRQPWLHAHEPEWLVQSALKTRASVDRPELLILSGFLGSGKTSLLRRFIEYCLQRDRFVAVIQNEIGEIGLDGKLLDHEYSVVELDEGCVCCSLAGQLKKGLAQILERFKPDVAVLETSGLANPKNLRAELGEVSELVECGALLILVDGANIENTLRQSTVARDQIEAADALVLNKIDLLSEEELFRVEALLGRINPRALLLRASEGDIPFGLVCDAACASPSPKRSLLPRLDDLRRPAHADEGYAARTVHCPCPVDEEQLRGALREAAVHAFRIKGIVDLESAGLAQPEAHLVQIVAGRIELTPLIDPGAERYLICIGREGVEQARETLARLWREEESLPV